jgi:ribosomal protein S12 methylthiotransferase accessory factor
LYLLDAGIHIPTVLCVARGDGRNWPGITLGLGTHLSPRAALRKAVLELGQTGPHLCDVMRDGEERVPSRPDEVRTFRQHALYYLPAERKQAFDFLGITGASIPLSALGEPEEISIAHIARRLSEAGVRIAIADVTSEDVKETPFRIVRALGGDVQQIHYGFGLERTNNRRLKNLLEGPINSGVHPIC